MCLLRRADLNERARWRRGLRPCSLARIATKWTTSRGTPLTQSYSAHRAKRIGGSRSGTHGVRDTSPFPASSYPFFFCDQKVDIFNNVHSKFPRSKLTMLQTANLYFTSPPVTSSSSCPTGRTRTTPPLTPNGLPWTAPRYPLLTFTSLPHA